LAQLKEAEESSRRPKPIVTADVRARLRSLPVQHPNLEDPRLVVNALIQLAHPDKPIIRNVGRDGERSARWVPVGVSDDEIGVSDSYASDFERISEAVDRAVKRLKRPVTASDIQEEIDSDPLIRPIGKSALADVISEAAKETLGDKGSTRRPRVNRRVFRAGSIKNTSYYHNDADSLASAKAYVRLHQLEIDWAESRIESELKDTKLCSLPAVAAGRALRAEADARKRLRQIRRTVLQK